MQLLPMDQSSTEFTFRLFINNFDNSFIYTAIVSAVASATFAVADDPVPAAFFFAHLTFFVAAFASAVVETRGYNYIEQVLRKAVTGLR